MNISHIEHIGIAVKDIETSKKYYEEVLGLTCYAVEEVEDQKVKTAFFRVGDTKIELLESTSADGPVGKYIERKGEGIHHINVIEIVIFECDVVIGINTNAECVTHKKFFE